MMNKLANLGTNSLRCIYALLQLTFRTGQINKGFINSNKR
jgi:hypothetical protein